MAHAGGPTVQAVTGGPRTAPPPSQTERHEQKKELTSWWKNFRRRDKVPEQHVTQGIFGVPLQSSIRYANVAISLLNDEGQSYIYGYVPIVVAKCGVFLKEKATDVEGIFRLAGSEKRIKELKVAFDSPDRFGKGLDWTGYTVHDAANILRRYFNQLPEPIIPLDFYDRFRDPLRNHQAQAVGTIEAQSPSIGEFDPDHAIRIYQNLITELPPLNRQLLLYILDLLAVFSSKSDLNKMTTANLSAIFQPGILSHPQHDMAPLEYRLSQDVLIFLIENQDSFLIGMQGTAVDAETVRDVQSGAPAVAKPPSTPTTPPNRSKTIIGRSSSNASAADSTGKLGSLRRHVSVSSKNSKRSDNGPTAVTPTGSVHRSNTVPSRRGGSNSASPLIGREKSSEPSTPQISTPVIGMDSSKLRQESLQSTPIASSAPPFPVSLPVPLEPNDAPSNEATTPLAPVASNGSSRMYETPERDMSPLLSSPEQSAERNAQNSGSSAGKGFLSIFNPSPTEDGRQPRKLQKRRIPGSSLSSAQSSSQSLENAQRSPIAAALVPGEIAAMTTDKTPDESAYATPRTTSSGGQPAQPQDPTNDNLKVGVSPSHSFHSNTDVSDVDMVGDDMPREQVPQPDKEKKRHRWRFSRSQNKFDPSSPQQQPSPGPLGTMTPRDQTASRSTFGSNGARKSFQQDSQLTPAATDPAAGNPFTSQTWQSSSTDPGVFSDSEREKKGGLRGWLRGKMSDNKDKEVEKRARTPDRQRNQRESKQNLHPVGEALPVRGKSFEQERKPSAASEPGAMPSLTQAEVDTLAYNIMAEKPAPMFVADTAASMATENHDVVPLSSGPVAVENVNGAETAEYRTPATQQQTSA